MSSNNDFGIQFDLPKNQSNVIKVIGVGGGGSNAINYMFKQGINGVDFVVCNTDAQALNESPVPIKIQLGASLTEGLGAGANPDVGAEAAQESYEDIKSLLNTQTKMIFITAGMGGGTGTGAAPIIARMAKELDILTVGIVTMPFQFEGKIRIDQAQKGLEKIKSEVDSLVVINNNKLREVFGNLGFKAGFSKADEVLSKAARGIAEVITHHYTQNIDLKDAKTVLSNSGSAIMGSGTASGTNRAQEAIIKALDSPLLNDNKITGSKNVLLLIVSGSEEITIDEIGEINDYIQSEAGNNTNIIMGVGEDEELENEISVTIIATGFNIDQQNEIVNTETKKVIHTLEEDQKMEHILISNDEKKVLNSIDSSEELKYETSIENSTDNKRFNLLITDEIRDIDVIFEEVNYDNTITKDVMKTSELEFVTDDNIIDEFEGDFIINELSQEVQDIEVIEEELIDADKENQITFDFGIPNSRIESIDGKLTNLNNSDVDINKDEIFIDSDKSQFSELFNIEVNDPEVVNPKKTNEENPFDKTLSETASIENKKRMVQLKKFNYSFKNNLNKIDDLEKEPAYKRHGLKLDQEDNTSTETKLIIETDDNDEIQLKSNNSFLHDNVD